MIRKVKKECKEWEKNSANPMSDKRLISRIYKDLLQDGNSKEQTILDGYIKIILTETVTYIGEER